MKLFVYGTLKKGFPNAGFLKEATFIQEAVLDDADLVHLGGFPGLVPGRGSVTGELYEITSSMLPALDRLEGVPFLYKRETVDFKGEEVFVYVYQAKMPMDTYKVIEGGNWE